VYTMQRLDGHGPHALAVPLVRPLALPSSAPDPQPRRGGTQELSCTSVVVVR